MTGEIPRLGDVETDTVTVSDGEMGQLVDLVSGGTLTARTLRIETDGGTVEVEPTATSLELSAVDE